MENTVTAVLIDDEINSLQALRTKLTRYCPQVQVVGECQGAEEGISAIEECRPDLVFLDVEMPRMNGFVLLQQLQNTDFELIFTTAYDQYAIQAIRTSALDYLMKPIEVENLQLAVDRACRKRRSSGETGRIQTLLHNMLRDVGDKKRLAVPTLEGLQFVDTDSILYLEADGNYTLLRIADDQKIVVSKTLKEFEDVLPAKVFIRIHHSYLINKQHVVRYIRGEGGQVVMRNGRTLDVARRKKEEFLRAIDKL